MIESLTVVGTVVALIAIKLIGDRLGCAGPRQLPLSRAVKTARFDPAVDSWRDEE